MTQHTRDTNTPSPAQSAPVSGKNKDVFSAADLETLSRLGRWGTFCFILFKVYRKNWWIGVPVVAFVIYRIWSGGPFGYLWMIAIASLFAPIVMLTWNTLFDKVSKYEMLLDAVNHGRWDEVLNREPKLRGHVPDFDLDLQLAIAWTGLGRLSDALALLERYQSDPVVPQSHYYIHLASIYELAGRVDDGKAFRRKAHESDPKNGTVALSFASALLAKGEETDVATRLIADVEATNTQDNDWMMPYAKGLAALNDGTPREALAFFQNTESILKPWTKARSEARYLTDLLKANQAIALAQLGNKSEAQALFQSVRPRFEALNRVELIARYERAMES